MADAKKKNYQYIYYGTQTGIDEVRQYVLHMLKANERSEAKGKRKTPVCIWGRHGIGKTHSVEQIAAELGYKFSYIAPAQFEEMGDLMGMPSKEGSRTVYAAPDWVPTEEGPGILLIDDVNRADDRILRGIMQLLQNGELAGWKLPKGWHIVLTANPDGGDYSVTPMDDAMLTRMTHITQKFDPKVWAKWAEKDGIDERGINFVLTYPEMVTGERTTPRSLVSFFESIIGMPDLEKEIGLVQMLADGCLDTATVTSFMSFVQNNLSKLVTPEQIVNAKDFNKEVMEPIKNVAVKGTPRIDILATLTTRMVNYLTVNNVKPTEAQMANIKKFILLDFIPNDIRLAMAQDLVSSTNTHLKMIMADLEIGKLLLKRM